MNSPAPASVPRCLETVKWEFRESDQTQVANMVFQIHCKACGASAFQLHEILTGESTTGVLVVCESCASEALLFDGMKHGYDGELGHTAMYIRGAESRHALQWHDGTPKRHDRIFVMFVYNIEIEEREETAAERKVAVVDQFDWINIIEDDPKKGEVMWEYECA